MSERPATFVDHLVYGVLDLDDGVREIAGRLGVVAKFGGRHEGLGTHNALLDLGDRRYLEILALDPTQTERVALAPRLETLSAPAFVAWCARTDDLDAVGRVLDSLGIAAQSLAVSRTRPDGVESRGRVLLADSPELGPVVPFFIQSRRGDHPSVSAPIGANLIELRLETPAPARLNDVIAALGVDGATVAAGDAPSIRALIGTRGGVVTL